MKAVTRLEADIARPIAIMRAYHGHGPDGTYCGTCDHLRHFKRGLRWTKCSRAANAKDPGPDWSESYPACALYEPLGEIEQFGAAIARARQLEI